RNLTSISAKDFLADLQNAVCLIVKDGFSLRFAHRSFQTYFAAVYTSEVLTDEQQARLFSLKLDVEDCSCYFNYFLLLSQIEPERFFQNALEKGLREIISCADSSDSPDEYVLKELFEGSVVLYKRDNEDGVDKSIIEFLQRTPDAYESVYSHNALSVFTMICFDWKRVTRDGRKDPETIKLIRRYYSAVRKKQLKEKQEAGGLLESVEPCDIITDDDCNAFYASLIKTAKIKELIKHIRKILDDLDNKHAALKEDDFIDSL
ncbi:MAG: hypothetical protein UIH27_19590, partial [Ruminococcus sp.]|nr:hypothetical protein [Ruminococcus sp.]